MGLSSRITEETGAEGGSDAPGVGQPGLGPGLGLWEPELCPEEKVRPGTGPGVSRGTGVQEAPFAACRFP